MTTKSATPKLKDVIGTTCASTLKTINDVVPLAGVTITTALVVTNSWIGELANTDVGFTEINKLKKEMLK